MKTFHSLWQNVHSIIRGNQTQLELALTALICGRHVLIEDIPGKGKTLIAKVLGKIFHLDFKRIQFTNDLMPSDMIGHQFFQQQRQEFIFRKGPIFGDIVLADEINRASPRTQSALLQAMEEKKVTIENETFSLSEVFFVMATQNPREQAGTAPLPESQLDRFLFKFAMGDLSEVEEKELLRAGPQHQAVEELAPLFQKVDILQWRKTAKTVKVPETIIDWTSEYLQKSRNDVQVLPLGARAGIDFIDALKAYAFLQGREVVAPEDVAFLFPFVFAHRLFASKRLSVAQEFVEAKAWLHGTHLSK